jgi:hypothetical protein
MIVSNCTTPGLGTAQTPASNTGSNRQDLHGTGLTYKLDYLVVTGVGDTDELIDIVWAATGVNWDYQNARPGTRGIHYDLILRSSTSIELAIKYSHTDATQNSYRLSIPGKPLGDLNSTTLSALGQELHRFGCRATRFDWAIDDYDRQLSVDWFEEQGKQNNYSGSREFGVWYKRRYGQMNDAKTVYFGSFQSDKLLRIYDKNIESKGKINAIRFEGQYRNAIAQVYFNALFHDKKFSENAQTISNYAIGSVNFIYRINAILSRCPVIDDWRTFCERVGQAIKISAKRIVRTIQEKMKWIEKQVAGTLAQIALCNGDVHTVRWIRHHIAVKKRQIKKGSNELSNSLRDKRIVDDLGYQNSLDLKRTRKGSHPNQLEIKLCQVH